MQMYCPCRNILYVFPGESEVYPIKVGSSDQQLMFLGGLQEMEYYIKCQLFFAPKSQTLPIYFTGMKSSMGMFRKRKSISNQFSP